MLLLATGCEGRHASPARERIARPLQEEILRRAEADLDKEPLTITAFPAPKSAGGPHDFFSEADYRWPDPGDPDKPYIGRDGYSNPDNFLDHRRALNGMSMTVANLASAWLLTGDRKYAEAILPHLYAWFVNEDTMMNPSLDYAQASHGISTGTNYGIIDTIHLIEVVEAMRRLRDAGLMPDDLAEGTKAWFYRYVDWLTKDPKGIKEMRCGNNHGVCWILQVGNFARYVGWTEWVEFAKNRFKYKFLPEMAVDGSFPMEIRRTKGYGYSLFNLDAMVGLCQTLSTSEDDLWTFVSENGRNILQALDFIFPYIQDKAIWPKEPDVMCWDEWPVAHPSLIFAWNRFRDDQKAFRTLPPAVPVKEFGQAPSGGCIGGTPPDLSEGRVVRPATLVQDWYDTWLALEHFPQNEEVLRNLPLRNPVLWLL
ncbi:MAG: alginate lyase family protein [Bacteroidales bacterium]|nr:alginate lyase family protein [Bacteroidales bacterium]